MSAMLGVRQEDAVRFISDAVAVDLTTGAVGWIGQKQYLLKNGLVVAGMGSHENGVKLARCIEDRIEHFDELADVAPSMWREVQAALSPAEKAFPAAAMIAGWSAKTGRAEMHAMAQREDEFGFWPNAPAYLAGPGNDSAPAKPFHERLCKDQDAFDVRRDGLDFMEAMRRQCFRECKVGPRPAVGGFVQLSTISCDGVRTEIIRHYSDRVGRAIEPDAVVDPHAMRDENWSGATMAEVYKIRETIVGCNRHGRGLAWLKPTAQDIADIRRYPDLHALFDMRFEIGSAAHYLGVAADAPWDVAKVREAVARHFGGDIAKMHGATAQDVAQQ